MKPLAFLQKNALYIIFAQALIAMIGSLYFSEILHLPPCLLCWYQRIAMYPIVLIAAIAIWNNDKKAYRHILPLASIGLIISIYHNLLYYGIIPESIAPCVLGVSCTTKLIEIGGFITIPLLSLVAHLVIVGAALISRKANRSPAP